MDLAHDKKCFVFDTLITDNKSGEETILPSAIIGITQSQCGYVKLHGIIYPSSLWSPKII